MKKIIFLFIIVLCFGCNKSNEVLSKEKLLEPSKTDCLLSWPKTDHYEVSDYYCEFDSLKYVVLDTRQESLLGQIKKLFLFENRILVLSNSLKMFDLSGKYLYDIGAFGRAANEYNRIGNVFVSQNKDIYVSDYTDRRIIKYSSNGEYLTHFVLESETPDEFVVLSDSIILGSYSGSVFDRPYYRFKSSSIQGVDRYCAFPNETGMGDAAGKIVPIDSKECVFIYPFSDVIYRVDKDSIQPYISLGMYENTSLESFLEKRKGMDINEYNDLIFSQDKVASSIQLVKCDSSWFLMYQLGKKSIVSFIDSERRDYVRANSEIKEVYYAETFVSSHQDWLLGYVEPLLYDYLNDNQISEIFSRIENATGKKMTINEAFDQNPVIVMYHLKNNSKNE